MKSSFYVKNQNKDVVFHWSSGQNPWNYKGILQVQNSGSVLKSSMSDKIQTPSCFLWLLDQSCNHTSSYYCHPKKFSLLLPYRTWYPRLLTGFDMLIFFTNSSLMEFQVRYLALFCLFSVIEFQVILDAGSS